MSAQSQHLIVVGAGAAGHSAAHTLRLEGYDDRLTVVHGEEPAPYNRTLVNKAVMQGFLAPAQSALPQLASLNVEMVTGRAASLDTEASEVVLDDGARLPYTALIAATGNKPRRRYPADLSERLLQLHTIDDAVRIRELLGEEPGRSRVTLLGAGFIGSETASYLAGLGAEVHLVSRPAVPLAGALGDAIARRVAELHHDRVETHFGRSVTAVSHGRDSVAVTLDDGSRVESDFAIVAYGTVPTSEWLPAGPDGIAVDDRLRACHLRNVYGAGSVAVHRASTGHRYRVDHWDAAAAQGAHAARALLHDAALGKDPGPYTPATGFTLSLYDQRIMAYGVPVAGSLQEQHPVSGETGALTTFRNPATGSLTAAVALGAARELMTLRRELRRP